MTSDQRNRLILAFAFWFVGGWLFVDAVGWQALIGLFLCVWANNLGHTFSLLDLYKMERKSE